MTDPVTFAGPVTTWADVSPGDVVEGKDHGLWTVLEKDPSGRMVLESVASGNRHEGSPPPDGEVKIVIPVVSSMAAATALTTVLLGGEEIGHRNEDGRWMAPVTFVHLGSVLGHLHVFHGGAPAEATLGGALAYHHRLHGERVRQVQEHVHDPDYHRGRSA